MKRVCSLFICLIFLSSCAYQSARSSERQSEYLLGTLVTITIYDYGTAAENIINECFSIISDYERMFSYYDENSELFGLNMRAAESPVKVSDELFEIIDRSLFYCKKTDGAFDIGLGKLIEIWDIATTEMVLPADGLVSEFVGFRGYEHIVLDRDEKTIFFDDIRTSVHLGACAKGFVEDKVVSFLRGNGVKSALLDFGGSIYAIGSKNGNPFTVGVTDPASEGELAGAIDIADLSVVTSGNYRRFFEYDGIIYHHILDSDTAYPSTSDINGVTIVCDSAFTGDCFSTAAFVLGSEDASELLKEEKLGFVIITDESVQTHGVVFKNDK